MSKGLSGLALITNQHTYLHGFLNSYSGNVHSNKNHTKIIQKILHDKKIFHLDVGARDGLHDVLKKYTSFLDIIMCEPEQKEAALLKKKGYRVIAKGLSDTIGEATFFQTRMPHASSIKRPRGPFMDFYNADPNYLALYETVQEQTIDCTTISRALSDFKVPELDLLKLDTQGSELEILTGMGEYAPLLIICELQYLPLYHDAPTAYEICQYLFDLGYIPFDLPMIRMEGNCPIEGDGYFMPSWGHPLGKKLIQGREEKYIALMIMFDQKYVLDFAAKKLEFKEKVPPIGLSQRLNSIFLGSAV